MDLGLFGDDGPVEDEETREAQPPERFLFDHSQGPHQDKNVEENEMWLLGENSIKHPRVPLESNEETQYRPHPSYDMWTVGVLFLEILLGTRSVFSVDQRTRALLTWKVCSACCD
jgi:hypothetical protein